MNETLCKHLRTKKMFTGYTPEEAFADKVGEHVTPCHYWCNLTQTVVGVDDQPVQKAACGNPARACFES